MCKIRVQNKETLSKQLLESQKCRAAKGFVVPHASLTVSTDMLDRFLKAHWGLQNECLFECGDVFYSIFVFKVKKNLDFQKLSVKSLS